MLHAAGESYFHHWWNLAQCIESGHISDFRQRVIWFLFTERGSARAAETCAAVWTSGCWERGQISVPSLVTWVVNNTWLVCGARPLSQKPCKDWLGPHQQHSRNCPSFFQVLAGCVIWTSPLFHFCLSVYSQQHVRACLGPRANPHRESNYWAEPCDITVVKYWQFRMVHANVLHPEWLPHCKGGAVGSWTIGLLED